jgi:hypothetical protein
MTADPSDPIRRSIAVLVGRLIFAGVFGMAAGFESAGVGATAG